MADSGSSSRFNVVTALVGGLLLLVAAVVAWDASTMTRATPYGMGPEATPYLIAGGLFLLGCAHLFTAARSAPVRLEPTDPAAVAWIVGGLLALIAVIWLGGGFIPATTLLFAATARGFSRRALIADLAIGFGLALLVYLVFTTLLILSLPQGPLERLF